MDTPLFSSAVTIPSNSPVRATVFKGSHSHCEDQLDHLKEVVNPGESNPGRTIRIGYQSFLDTNLIYQILKRVSQEFPQIDLPLFRGTPSNYAINY